jgi:phosphorylase kinase alpha/beta subunit
LTDGLLTVADLDPLGRHLRIGQQRRSIVQVALIAEE